MDNHIRKDASVSWLVEIQTVCKEIFSTFNWGKNYNFFLQICKDLDIEMKKLTTFQMTRLTNSVRFVFVNFRVISSAIQLALLNLIASKEDSSAVKGRK